MESCQIFDLEILMDLHVLRPPESDVTIFSLMSVRLCVCASVRLCVCAYVRPFVCGHDNSRRNCRRELKFGMNNKNVNYKRPDEFR